MGMVVRTNTMALNAYRQLGMNNSAVTKSLEKLSSGFRINRAGDDAAGLAISEKMKAQIKGLETASANAQDGISLIQTAEGNLTEVHDMLNRMVELSSKSANGTYTSTERKAMQDEMDQLLDEIDRISKSANFNGTKLLNGTMGLNNEALTIGESSAYVAPGALEIKADQITATHFGAAAAEQKPEFSVDFQDYSWTSAAPAAGKTGTATIGLTLNGKDIKLWDGTDGNDTTDITKAAGAADTAVTITGADVATALAGKKVVVDDKFVYDVKAGDGTTDVKFTYAGTWNATDSKIDKTTVESADVANLTPKGNVEISLSAKDEDGAAIAKATETGRNDCPVYKIKDPAVGGTAKRAGASLKLTADMVKDGYSLKIGDETFTFDASTTAAAASGNTIGIKDLSGADLLKSVTQQLSNKTTTIKKKDATGTEQTYTFNIGRNAATDTIEIEEEDPAAGKTVGGFTEAEMKAAFSLKAKETMANTKLTISDNAKLADKEKILVDGTEYEFAKGATLNDTMTNLKGALGSKYTVTTETDSEGKGVVTISAKNASDKSPALAGSGLTLQIGDTADTFNKMNVKVADMSAKGLALEDLKTKGIMNEVSASAAIDKIKTAINTVSSQRATMGALQNRLEHTINNLDVAVENMSAANSRIRDTDMAKEMMNYTKMNVLVQSAQAMLAQANQQPQSVLQLLQ